jgi:predicted HicB family RNase H-like nuclease
MKQVLIRLTPEQHEILRKKAFDARVSIAEFVRRLVAKTLKQ